MIYSRPFSEHSVRGHWWLKMEGEGGVCDVIIQIILLPPAMYTCHQGSHFFICRERGVVIVVSLCYPSTNTTLISHVLLSWLQSYASDLRPLTQFPDLLLSLDKSSEGTNVGKATVLLMCYLSSLHCHQMGSVTLSGERVGINHGNLYWWWGFPVYAVEINMGLSISIAKQSKHLIYLKSMEGCSTDSVPLLLSASIL